MSTRISFWLLCLSMLGCGENPAPQIVPVAMAHPTYLVVSKVNGKQASGTTFRRGDTIEFEGRFEIEDDRESVAQLLAEIVKTRSDIGEVRSSWSLTDLPQADGSRAFKYRGEIEVTCSPGTAVLRCMIPFGDNPVVGSVQLTIVE